MTLTARQSFQEEKVAEVKNRIIDAAFVCFGRYGYQGAKLTQIAELARCSRELPRYHFSSKEGLVMACLSHIRSIWLEIFQDMDPVRATPEEFIEHILGRLFTINAENDAKMMGVMVLIFGAADPSNKDLRNEMLKTQQLGHEYFEKFLTAHDKRNPVDQRFDVRVLSKVLFDAFRGVVYHYMMAPESTDYAKLLGEYRKLFLKTLQPKPAF